jgi:hypothetical protein
MINEGAIPIFKTREHYEDVSRRKCTKRTPNIAFYSRGSELDYRHPS